MPGFLTHLYVVDHDSAGPCNYYSALHVYMCVCVGLMQCVATVIRCGAASAALATSEEAVSQSRFLNSTFA